MSFLRFVFGFAFLSVLPAALEGVHEEENLEAALRSFRSAKSADFSRLPQPNPLMPAPAFPFELQLLANAAPVRDVLLRPSGHRLGRSGVFHRGSWYR